MYYEVRTFDQTSKLKFVKKIILTISLVASSIWALHAQAPVCKFSANPAGTTSQVLPNANQLQKTTATSNIFITTGGAAYTPQQQIVIDYVRNIWEQSIVSTVPIKITLTFQSITSLGLTTTNNVSSVGKTSFSGEPALQANTLYPKALINKLTHVEQNSAAADAIIKINTTGAPAPYASYTWYYGKCYVPYLQCRSGNNHFA